jgi:hypothetical protein
MSEIHHDKDGHPSSSDPTLGSRLKDAKCHFCYERPDACWHGAGGFFFVCADCATDEMPKLIADAIAARYGDAGPATISPFLNSEQRILKTLWRGACSTLSRRHSAYRSRRIIGTPSTDDTTDQKS